jgi:hypothetical protein
VDAIVYVVRTGCAWRQLPVDFPPWQTVYWYFVGWEKAKVTSTSLRYCGGDCAPLKDGPGALYGDHRLAKRQRRRHRRPQDSAYLVTPVR